jgi:hypothetical protein
LCFKKKLYFYAIDYIYKSFIFKPLIMKTKLLSLIVTMVLGTGITHAQKTWDFGNDHTTWPNGSGYPTGTVIDNLGLYGSAPGAESPITNFGTITSNNATFADGYTATSRFQLNGAGFSGTTPLAAPTQRFLYFDVSGSCTVKVWFKTGSNGATRTVYVSDGTTILGSGTSNSGTNNDFVIFTATYTGGPKQLYVYGGAANNLYKMQVSGASVSGPGPVALSSEEFKAASSLKVFANQKQVSVANVTSATQVDVYSLTGALVKSFNTNSDVSFDLASTGLYIVNLTSAGGQKSVKVLVE